MDFHKFKRTKHIFDAGGSGVSRDDLVMTNKESENYLKNSMFVIEEKVDGANIGLSIDENLMIKAQNRSHFVNSTSHKQFSTLDAWIENHSEDLFKILNPPGKYILFGEWLFAKHSIHYSHLPDLFLAFDIFNKEKKEYLSVVERNSILDKTSISVINQICQEENITKKRVSLQIQFLWLLFFIIFQGLNLFSFFLIRYPTMSVWAATTDSRCCYFCE